MPLRGVSPVFELNSRSGARRLGFFYILQAPECRGTIGDWNKFVCGMVMWDELFM